MILHLVQILLVMNFYQYQWHTSLQRVTNYCGMNLPNFLWIIIFFSYRVITLERYAGFGVVFKLRPVLHLMPRVWIVVLKVWLFVCWYCARPLDNVSFTFVTPGSGKYCIPWQHFPCQEICQDFTIYKCFKVSWVKTKLFFEVVLFACVSLSLSVTKIFQERMIELSANFKLRF